MTVRANGILVDENHVLDVQAERTPVRVERRGELGEVVGLQPPTHREHRIACVPDLQHRPSRTATQAARRAKALNLLELDGQR